MSFRLQIQFLFFLFLPLLLFSQNEVSSAGTSQGLSQGTSLSFNLKSAPANLNVYLNGNLVRPLSSSNELRYYQIEGNGNLSFRSPGYVSQDYVIEALPLINDQNQNNFLQIKLELENGSLQNSGRYVTGIQPKSVYFTPDGSRLVVPLLGERGIDIFRVVRTASIYSLIFERRLLPPGGNAAGFVEAFMDANRREIWVSNMTENRVYIFDMDSLEYKMSMSTGGIFPKVITQNPEGNLTLVSNWTTHDISVFDSDTKELLGRIPVGGIPRGMAFSPDGFTLYAAIYDAPIIAVVDMAERRLRTSYRLYEGVGAARHIIYDEGNLYVSDMYRGTVNIVNANSGVLLASRRIGPNINTIVLTPDGSHIFASSRGRNNAEDYTRPGPDLGALYMLRSDDLSLVERVWGGNQPTGLAVSPDGALMVFSNFLDGNLELYIIK